MSANERSEKVDHNRRTFCGTTAIAVAAAQLGIFVSKEARAGELGSVGATASRWARTHRLAP
jgi:hypothetical protein